MSSSSDTKDEGGEDTKEKEINDHVESIKVAAEIYGDRKSTKKKPPEEADDSEVLMQYERNGALRKQVQLQEVRMRP